jgi:hypothetical protein
MSDFVGDRLDDLMTDSVDGAIGTAMFAAPYLSIVHSRQCCPSLQ